MPEIRVPLVLRAPWWLVALTLLWAAFCAGLGSASVWLLVTADYPLSLQVVLGIVVVSVAVLVVFGVGTSFSYTRLTTTGVELKRGFRKPTFYPYASIRGFGIAEKGGPDGGHFRAKLFLANSLRSVNLAGGHPGVVGIVRSWMGTLIEDLNAWLPKAKAGLADDPRPYKRRAGARVLVVAEDQVLLLADSDPGVPGARWWVLPGGGLDEGENPAAGAARELLEETGLVGQLVGPIATRVVTHAYSDRILVQDEVFFRLDTTRQPLQPTRLTPGEQLRGVSAEWVPVADLRFRTTWPSDLGRLLAATRERPLDWGEVDESTVPAMHA